MEEGSYNVNEIAKEVKKQFGEDKIKLLNDRINLMSSEELKKVIMVAANKVGSAIKKEDYVDVKDTIIHMNMGAHIILEAYDIATLCTTEGVEQ